MSKKNLKFTIRLNAISTTFLQISNFIVKPFSEPYLRTPELYFSVKKKLNHIDMYCERRPCLIMI